MSRYKEGDWNATCSMCGGDFKASELIQHWQGMFRCRRCWEPRHPQDFVRAGRPEKSVPWIQNPPDVDITDICTLEGRTAVPGYAIPICSLPSFTGGVIPPYTGSPSDGGGGGGGEGEDEGDPAGNPGWEVELSLTIEVDPNESDQYILTWSGGTGPYSIEVAEGDGAFFEVANSLSGPTHQLGDSIHSGFTDPSIVRVVDSLGAKSGGRFIMLVGGNPNSGDGTCEVTWTSISHQGYNPDTYEVYGISSFGWEGNTIFNSPLPDIEDMALLTSVGMGAGSAFVAAPGIGLSTTWGYRIVAYRNGIKVAETDFAQLGVVS